MARFIVEGGIPLQGRVRASGAKNAVLPIMAATVLVAGEYRLVGVPRLSDVEVMAEILRRLGVKVTEEREGDLRCLCLDTRSMREWRIHEFLMRGLRSSIFLLAPLMGRMGEATVSYPGGCAIGPRPVDLHLHALSALGARLAESHGCIHAEATMLTGGEVVLSYPSVGATETAIMAATLASGETVIRGAAREPEIVDLQNFLNGLGARIRGVGTPVIRITGVERLNPTGEHAIIPDRIEAGTYLLAGAVTGGVVQVDGARADHLRAFLSKLARAGVVFRENEAGIVVERSGRLRGLTLKTGPYPGFPTDLQPQISVLAAIADGESRITEAVFENRLGHWNELRKMGAKVLLKERTALAEGGRLRGTTVAAADLRGGAALILAALAATGETVVEGTKHIDRGYEDLEGKLGNLGARIRREADELGKLAFG